MATPSQAQAVKSLNKSTGRPPLWVFKKWRELNTAEDFISFYEQMTPLVQTLPLILLSLEPILRLIAALSGDLLEDFIPFLPRIVDSLASLLHNGADRDPEIIEQIFTSWSYIMVYLQKYLVHKLVDMLEVTAKLRYYPKDYVQEFTAQAMGFLLRTRTAPLSSLKKVSERSCLTLWRNQNLS
ncbi:hypothetical protein M0R45_031682 [Rubus argutus]|uniref:Uncharacterized protein n=1 Tax=Rubus argutus TaxID=59490 RepID=A0AAW1WIV6_RUBAR